MCSSLDWFYNLLFDTLVFSLYHQTLSSHSSFQHPYEFYYTAKLLTDAKKPLNPMQLTLLDWLYESTVPLFG